MIFFGDTGPTSLWVLALAVVIGITCILLGSVYLGIGVIVLVAAMNLPRLIDAIRSRRG